MFQGDLQALADRWKSRLRLEAIRLVMNTYPPYWSSGARVVRIRPDFHELEIEIRLGYRNRNVVGTIFGGSLYAAVDPIYMLMFMQILGKGYVVWDKAATIHFLKPGRGVCRGRFTIEAGEPESIIQTLHETHSLDRTYTVELRNENGEVCARVEKVLYFAKQRADKPQQVRKLIRGLF